MRLLSWHKMCDDELRGKLESVADIISEETLTRNTINTGQQRARQKAWYKFCNFFFLNSYTFWFLLPGLCSFETEKRDTFTQMFLPKLISLQEFQKFLILPVYILHLLSRAIFVLPNLKRTRSRCTIIFHHFYNGHFDSAFHIKTFSLFLNIHIIGLASRQRYLDDLDGVIRWEPFSCTDQVT